MTTRGLIFLALCLCITPQAMASPTPPNLIIILADDLGYGDLASYQKEPKVAQTPNIDRLGREGMQFTSMRANCTVCSPSRAALLTGRFPDRVGVPGVIRSAPANNWGWFDPKVPTLASELKSVGYHTALVGKWHLGLESPNLPNERGFDLFHGFLGDMMDSYTTHLRHGTNYMRRNTEGINPEGHATDLFSEWTISYLRERARNPEQPFFLYLAYNAPHTPIEPPADWVARVQQRMPKLEEKRARYLALVEHMDAGIGRVLAALKETGLDSTTVVAFSSDNGGYSPAGANNAPWRDGKGSHFDGGLKVPFLVRWPGQIPAGSLSDYPGLLFDLFPTFLELAGATKPSDLDAASLLPVLQGKNGPDKRDLYFVRREGGKPYHGEAYHALVQGGWKLLQNEPAQPLALYNVQEDPQEATNLASAMPELAKKLSSILDGHIQRGAATPWRKPR